MFMISLILITVSVLYKFVFKCPTTECHLVTRQAFKIFFNERGGFSSLNLLANEHSRN